MIPTVDSVIPLARRWAAGDRAAGDELIRRHDDWIRFHARRMARETECPDDLAQLMRVGFLHWCARSYGADGLQDAVVKCYLRREMRKRVFWERRRDKLGPMVMSDDLEALVGWASARHSHAHDTHAAAVDVARLAHVAGLSEKELEVVRARSSDDSFRDIAHDMGLGVGSVSFVYDGAIEKLRAAAGLRGRAKKRSSPTSADGVEERIVDLLRVRGPMQSPEIREALGIKKSLAWNALSRLRAIGAVGTSGIGRSTAYELVDGKREEAA